jgi:PTS system mannose-specific IIC component
MALERRAFLQAMISRPLVAATTTGLLLGDVAAGVYIGLLFELMHLGGASLGGAHAEHDTLPAIAGAAFAAEMGNALGSSSTPAMWTVAVLVCMPAGLAGRALEFKLDLRARRYFRRALTAGDTGDLEYAAHQNIRAMWPQFVFYGLWCAAATVAGYQAAALGQSLPLRLVRGLAWAYPAMGVGAAAIAVHGSHARRRLVAAGLSAVVTALAVFAAWYGGVL